MATPRKPAPSPLAAYTVAAVAIGQVLFGLTYVGACELRSNAPGRCEAQWVTAQALIFGGTSTAMGLNTPNPALNRDRTPKAPTPPTPTEPPLRVAKPRPRRGDA